MDDDALSRPSSPAVKIAAQTPRPPTTRLTRSRRQKRSSLSSLEGQRSYLPGSLVPHRHPATKRRIRAHRLTWQEFVLEGFGPTVSLASLVSWQDMLCYSPPPPLGFDGPGTPPESQEAFGETSQQNAREGPLDRTAVEPSNDSADEGALILKAPRKHWRIGKSSKLAPFRKPRAEVNIEEKRPTVPSKVFGAWASRAKRFFHLKRKKSSNRRDIPELLPVNQRDHEEGSASSSSSTSPDPRQRLLKKDVPSKITVRKPSYRPDLPSVASSASSSSLSRTTPAVNWSYFTPPDQVSSANGLQVPPNFPQSAPTPSTVTKEDGQKIPFMSPLIRHHSHTQLNETDEEGAEILDYAMTAQRKSVPDSTKSHETLWRRSISSPSISSSYTSLSMLAGASSRQSSIWDYRGSATAIPRGSVASIGDVKRALRANLTGNMPPQPSMKEGTGIPSVESSFPEQIKNKLMHTHLHEIFSSSRRLNPFHADQDAGPSAEPETSTRPSTSGTTTPTQDGRRLSIVKKDHMDIYNHPYFAVAPGEKHKSLSSVSFGATPGTTPRRSTMDSTASYTTALDGMDDPAADASFSSF
ncbi:hypothetical protein Dda_9139 [Drechslerella dactyloides]|uniref:Uncharacterized protein n=1 Tax=Drechslerella dactyloides TaxID=74499 RepID=A0AAD6ITC1_DREDA|nr:hypothetical protein Dda_9139 [Drechslerella dactyloides]